MKKIVLVALALMLSVASFAQFRTAPREVGAPVATKSLDFGMAANFTVTSLDNQTIELQSWLDSGYYVLLDISATWCTWCWRLHQAHVLEQLYQNYGPNGTNEMRVIWVEGDPTTDHASLYNNSCGDWTAGVSYPIAEDDNIADAYNLTGYPTVVLICPSGYYQDAYDVCDWNGSQFVTSTSVAAIYNLMSNCPAAGEAPVAEIGGLNNVVAGQTATFTAEYVSVDPVTSVEWTLPGATPATATGNTASCVWNTPGNYTITLSVTNTTGTTTKTMDVNVIDWTWGDEMSYTLGGSYVSSVGTSSGITWGAKYPAAFMAGRNYLENVKVYANEAAHYTLDIYQANGAAPTANDMLYEYTYAVSAGDNTLPIYDQLQLDAAKDLWVVFTCSDASYPAAGTDFSGDPNGSFVCFNGEWSPVYDLNPELMYTWMISATTSATAPAMVVELNGPATATTNTAVTFTAVGPSAASYSWTFANGTPATATGSTVSTTWTTAGTYAVTLTATLNGETATKTMNVNVVSCDPRNLPFTCGFEANDDFGCWNFVDADGDGYNWDLEFGPSIGKTHSGSGSVGTASFRNDVGVLTPDNWMITPAIVVPAEGATIEWWVAGVDQNYYAEYYSVLVSTTGNNPADFTNTVFAGTVPNFDWTKVSRSLAGFAGQTIYVAFRHHNISDMYWMLLDDISITAGNHAGIDEVNDINVSLYPNPTTGKLNVNAEGAQEINVLDINGRVVMTANNTNTIDLSNLSNGCYFVRVITNAGVSTQKIVKE